MKKTLLTVLVFVFVGTGFSFSNSNMDPPDYEKTTLSAVADQNEIITSLGWMPISIDTFILSEGSFVFIKYQQGNTSFAFSSGIITDFEEDGYIQLKRNVFRCNTFIFKHQRTKAKQKQIQKDQLITSSGGIPYSYNS